MAWVASSVARPRNIASSAEYKRYQLTRTPRLPAVDSTVAPAESHGLVRFAERQNLVAGRVSSNLQLQYTKIARIISSWWQPIYVLIHCLPLRPIYVVGAQSPLHLTF
jgi:hypothetical protein